MSYLSCKETDAGVANFIDEWSQCVTFASQIWESFWNINWSQVLKRKKPFSDFPVRGPGMYTQS